MDYSRASSKLTIALRLARSDEPLPSEWIDCARDVAAEPYKTFTPFLGTALLAKAIDPHLDPLSIKEDYGARAYSARGLAHRVLVPRLIEEHIDIRNRGPEPLNNQPFFRYNHVSEIERVRYPEALERLKETLTRVDALDADGAALALAAFVRQRLQATEMTVIPVVGGAVLSLDRLVRAMQTFLAEESEGGKRAQAVVAGIMDCAFREVVTARINDPSRHYPGDVVAVEDGAVLLSVEVRTKPVSAAEVTRIVRECAAAGVSRCVVAAFAPSQEVLDEESLAAAALARGTILRLHHSAESMLYAGLCWLDGDIEPAVSNLPQRILRRLDGIEVRPDSLSSWVDLCGGD
ncbi:MAG: restriction endonuclease, SacI family [Coriobacteriia bacterium]